MPVQIQRVSLDRALQTITEHVQQMGSLVDHAIAEAMQALLERNVDLATQVIAGDVQINELRYEIEKECLSTLARHQPLATDLRTVVAATHVAGELERIGDHASSIAELVTRLDAEDPVVSFHKLPKMEKHARRMLQRAVRAFVEHDVEAARLVTRREEKLDGHYERLFHETLVEMQEDLYLTRAQYLLWAGRHLERIGDRATNIAERVIFVVTSEFVEIG